MKEIWRLYLAALLILTVVIPVRPVNAQDSLTAEALDLLAEMDVAERVGQLFLVTFRGDSISRDDSLTDLIVNYQIGGVVLLAAHDNISGENAESVPRQLLSLTNDLQRVALLDTAAFVTDTVEAVPNLPSPGGDREPNAVPLFVATQQEGDGAPYSQIRMGLTELPSAMAIGATWQPELAADVGEVVGRELSALGINMLLGPSLDVLERANPIENYDQGTRSFGGNPYWVGLMGQAYTAGVHNGSNGRLSVVAKHFPGQGSSDRPLGGEVATVRKSLTQLQEVELAPFFAVTGGAGTPSQTVDALLTTHIRYQGFQGNIQTTTPPVSFDPVALQQLLTLPELAGWRQQGGLIVSDALGNSAVQRFYDDSGQAFPHRRVAKDALFAGNDVLYVDEFADDPSDFEAQVANIRDTITWFQERYRTDPAFQQRVDDAVVRILRLKLRLYDSNFSPDNVLADPGQLSTTLDGGTPSMLNLAQQAVTLLSPGSAELAEQMPGPPGPDDDIVIFTDVREAQQCSSCPAQPYIGLNSLEERILALYGPEGSDQTAFNRILSFSMEDLGQFLDTGPDRILPPTPAPTPTPLEEPPLNSDLLTPVPTPPPSTAFQVQAALDNADLIIFAMLDTVPALPHGTMLERFLAERPDIVRESRILVFAYGAPYYLDTTEVSKLAAYYGLYSKTSPFLDASVRALFQEIPFQGAPPIDVEGIGYDLDRIVQPDPEQVIELFVVRDGSLQAPPGEQPLELVVGDTLRLQTGVIVDRNNRPVPDGTLVQFIRRDRLEGFYSVIDERPTVNGVATLDYILEARPGQFRITAASGDATKSYQLDIAVEENVRISASTPTPAPTATSTPNPTATPSPTPSITPEPTAVLSETVIPPPPEPSVEISLSDVQLLLSFLGGLLITGSAGWFLSSREDPADRLRLIAWGVVGALVAYNYYLLDLPGATLFSDYSGWAGFLTTLPGGLLGLLLGWIRTTRTPLLE